jgi:hypothetical protein
MISRRRRARRAKTPRVAGDVLHDRHGALTDERDRHRMGAHAVAGAERAAPLELLGALAPDGRVTLGADKGYDTRDFVAAVRLLGVTPHVAQNTTHRTSAIDGRTTRHRG